MLRVAVDRLHVLAVGTWQGDAVTVRRGHDHLAETHDEIERRAQFVTDGRREIGFEPPGFLRRLARPFQFDVHFLQSPDGVLQFLAEPPEFAPLFERLLPLLARQFVTLPRPCQRRLQRPVKEPDRNLGQDEERQRDPEQVW